MRWNGGGSDADQPGGDFGDGRGRRGVFSFVSGADARRPVAADLAPCPVDPRDCLAVRVVGDSMAPSFEDGDIAIVSRVARPREGSPALVRLTEPEDTVLCLFFREKNASVRLQPANPAHKAVWVRLGRVRSVLPVCYRIISFL